MKRVKVDRHSSSVITFRNHHSRVRKAGTKRRKAGQAGKTSRARATERPAARAETGPSTARTTATREAGPSATCAATERPTASNSSRSSHSAACPTATGEARTTSSNAQQQQQKPNTQQHAQQQQEKPDPQQHAQQQQQNKNNQQITQRQSNQPVQQQRTQQQQIAQQGEQRGDWQQRRAHSFDTEHRTWQQRGGYNGYRIPDVYFSSYYGSGHSFRVYGLPFMEVGGFPRFQYGGYWFSVVDPYPEFWGADWYQTDDVYVVYVDNGYYLYDSRYPGRPGVAISISL